MTREALFMPMVTVDEAGGIDTDWGQSFIHVYNGDDEEYDERPDDKFSQVLDDRLTRIRALLTGDDGSDPLAELVRPFFHVG